MIFGILEYARNDCIFKNNKVCINQILLIFTSYYIFKFKEKKFINLNDLIVEIQKVKMIGKEIALNDSMKTIAFTKK